MVEISKNAGFLKALKNVQSKAQEPAKPQQSKQSNGKDEIKITGFTKRLAERAEIAHNKFESKFFARLQSLKEKKPEAKIEVVTPDQLWNERTKEQIKIVDEYEKAKQEQDKQVHIIIDRPKDDIELDEYQNAALVGMRWQKYSCLIGAAGTGKTTTTKKLITQLEQTTAIININAGRRQTLDNPLPVTYAPAIAFCSFTGRAVQQLKRAIPKEYHTTCMTVHALLGFYPEYFEVERMNEKTKEMEWKQTMRFVPYFTKMNKLPFKIIVLDEAGMMPIDLWNQLVDALTDDVRIILIGDINQLPPVQGRSVLGFAMTKWPTFTLEKIHRQAADNPIIANAHRILRGEMPEKVPGVFDMVMMPNKDIDCYNKCIQAIKLLHGKKQFDPIQDGFIVPMNDYQLGQRTFNEILVGYFNPVREVEGIKINPRIAIATGMNQVVYSVGDKVMLLQNDRDRGLTNGMIGIVTEINLNGNYDGRRPGAENFDTSQDEHIEELNMEEFALEMEQKQIEIKEDDSATQRQASHITTVQFADEEVKFQTAGDYRKLTHAYAFTCHKSQGGEYPTVIILCHSATSLRMLSREWLYTAVTRARQRVVLLYNERGLKQAIGTQRIKGKTVAEKAESFIALQDKKDVNIPILWEPKELNPGD